MTPGIIFEDEQIVVLDKPAGITVNNSETTVGEQTVQNFVEKYLQIRNPKPQIPNKSQIKNYKNQNSFEFRDSSFEFANRAGIVHRIDKETSGILLVAKTEEAFVNLQSQFKERVVEKTYTALVHGDIKIESGEIVVPVGRLPWNRTQFGVVAGGREASTDYKVIGKYKNPKSKFKEMLTLLELHPKTGRTHQIRVHLKYFGHAIFADFLYAGRKTSRSDRQQLPRVFLHASKISFIHPKSMQQVSFESPLPEELKNFLEKLEKV